MRSQRTGKILTQLAVASALGITAVVTSSAGTVSAEPFVPLDAPQRIVDTRANGETIDDALEKGGAVEGGTSLTVQVGGRAMVPTKAAAVVLNVTAIRPTSNGFFTVYPCGDVPNASNLNFRSGQNIANTVVATLDETGATCVFTSVDSDMIIDVSGTFPADAFLGLDEPARIADTRPNGATIDGQLEQAGIQDGGSTLTVPVRGRPGIPEDADTAVLNVTTTRSSANGFFTVFPCGTRPTASNLNYTAGQIIANAAVSRIDADGNVCVYTSVDSNIVVDIAGTLVTDAFVALDSPQRIADTRLAGETADLAYSQIGTRNAGETMALSVAGRGDIPASASGVILNVTSVRPLGRGFVTSHPRGTSRPNASNLNFDAGQNIANVVVAKIGPDGGVCVYNSAATDLIIDVAGYLVGEAPPTGSIGCPENEQNLPSATALESNRLYTVGVDMQPGRYKMDSAPTGCFVDRFDQPFVDDLEPIGYASGADGRLIVDIRPTDVSVGVTSSCTTLRPYNDVPDILTNAFPGYSKVNVHVAPGVYNATVLDGCYVEIIESFDGSFGSIFANLYVDEGEAGDYSATIGPNATGFFASAECGVWTPATPAKAEGSGIAISGTELDAREAFLASR